MTEQVRIPRHFETFYSDNYRQVVALVYTLSGSRWAAEDLAQEAFLTAHERWDSVGRYDSPEGWVRTVAVNLARSRLRRLGAETRALGRWFGLQPNAFPELDVEHEQFWTHVRKLPRRQSEVVVLHYLEDLAISDIARILDISESSVKNSLAQAREKLATRISRAQVTT